MGFGSSKIARPVDHLQCEGGGQAASQHNADVAEEIRAGVVVTKPTDGLNILCKAARANRDPGIKVLMRSVSTSRYYLTGQHIRCTPSKFARHRPKTLQRIAWILKGAVQKLITPSQRVLTTIRRKSKY